MQIIYICEVKYYYNFSRITIEFSTSNLFRRFETAVLSENRLHSGHALHPTLGLLMVGGLHYSPAGGFSSDSTVDGETVDSTAVPDLDEAVYGNCVVAVNETTVISFGGVGNAGPKSIATFTIGDDSWKVNA